MPREDISFDANSPPSIVFVSPKPPGPPNSISAAREGYSLAATLMLLRTALLWIHALTGAAWVAASGCFVIAGLALGSGGDEQRNFALRAAPRIVEFNLIAAILVLLSGGVNLLLAGMDRNFRFSSEFVRIITIKIVLFVAMVLALRWTRRASALLRDDAELPAPANALTERVTVMVKTHAAVALMGGIALLLGLWLMGT